MGSGKKGVYQEPDLGHKQFQNHFSSRSVMVCLQVHLKFNPIFMQRQLFSASRYDVRFSIKRSTFVFMQASGPALEGFCCRGNTAGLTACAVVLPRGLALGVVTCAASALQSKVLTYVVEGQAPLSRSDNFSRSMAGRRGRFTVVLSSK